VNVASGKSRQGHDRQVGVRPDAGVASLSIVRMGVHAKPRTWQAEPPPVWP